MTALSDYAKLEAEAVFYDALTDTTTDVVVSFGERSLVIVSLDDRPLAHWPLATLVSRSKEGPGDVRIAPDRTAEDYITLNDAEMIRAIEAVCPDLEEAPTAPPKSRHRKRFWVLGILFFTAVIGYLNIAYVTQQITDKIAVDQEVRLGESMRALVIDSIGEGADVWECTSRDGKRSLQTLSNRLAHQDIAPLKIRVIDLPSPGVLTLPGGEMLLFRDMLDRTKSPEALAGVVAHQMAHRDARSPFNHMVAEFGLIDLTMFWWGADPEPELIETATQVFLQRPYAVAAELAADSATFDILDRAGLPSTPYADNLDVWAQDPRGALSFAKRHAGPQDRISQARSADKISGKPFQPALDDRSWLSLGNICDERQPLR